MRKRRAGDDPHRYRIRAKSSQSIRIARSKCDLSPDHGHQKELKPQHHPCSSIYDAESHLARTRHSCCQGFTHAIALQDPWLPTHDFTSQRHTSRKTCKNDEESPQPASISWATSTLVTNPPARDKDRLRARFSPSWPNAYPTRRWKRSAQPRSTPQLTSTSLIDQPI